MAHVNSDVFINYYTTPRTLNPSSTYRGAVYFARSAVTVSAADVAGTIYPMFRVPAHARILQIFLGNDAVTAAADCDFGIYDAGDWSNLAVDPLIRKRDAYVDGISMAVVRDAPVDPAQTLATAATNSQWNVMGKTITGSNAISGIQWARRIWEDTSGASGGASNPITTEPRAGSELDLCWTIISDPNPAAPVSIVTGIIYSTGA